MLISSPAVTVVIADDQTVVREGLRSMLSLFDTIEVLGVAASAESALDLVAVAEIGQGVQPLRAVQRQDDHAGVRAVQAFLCEQRHGAVS